MGVLRELHQWRMKPNWQSTWSLPNVPNCQPVILHFYGKIALWSLFATKNVCSKHTCGRNVYGETTSTQREFRWLWTEVREGGWDIKVPFYLSCFFWCVDIFGPSWLWRGAPPRASKFSGIENSPNTCLSYANQPIQSHIPTAPFLRFSQGATIHLP